MSRPLRNGADASVLSRVAFTTSRALEFFTESELTTQIGCRKGLWPLVLIKELIDNAIDACETATIESIEIGVELGKDFFSVKDNGPGITREVIKGILDYNVRISDKKHYVAPTRGQLGNALKCVVAAPFVVDGTKGVVEIVARGQRHTIAIQLDRIAQEPKIAHITRKDSTGIGTFLKVHWPQIACSFKPVRGDLYQFDSLKVATVALIEDYAAFNPHVSFTFGNKRFAATSPEWRKWRADAPTSAHWYRPDDLRALIAAYVRESNMPLRDFIANFAGLARTRVRANVAGGKKQRFAPE